MELYTDSKTASCTLTLSLIETNILPKRYSQRYKIKTMNSKMYDGQVNVTGYLKQPKNLKNFYIWGKFTNRIY